MAKWVSVAKLSDFENKHVVVVDYDDVLIAIFKLANGFYAIEDTCSHAEASLAEGKIVDGCEIECPLHGARFDIRTGEHLSFPAVTPVEPYPVKVEGADIFIEVNW